MDKVRGHICLVVELAAAARAALAQLAPVGDASLNIYICMFRSQIMGTFVLVNTYLYKESKF